MEVCSYNHDEIVYTTRNCPLCEALEDIESLAKELKAESNRADEATDLAEEYKSLLEEYNPEALL